MSDLLQRLNIANANLARLLECLRGDSSVQGAIHSDHLALILSELLRVGEWLHNRSVPSGDPKLAAAIAAYRSYLEQLSRLMPLLHVQLLTERARLEAERCHLEAAAGWAGTSRQTS